MSYIQPSVPVDKLSLSEDYLKIANIINEEIKIYSVGFDQGINDVRAGVRTHYIDTEASIEVDSLSMLIADNLSDFLKEYHEGKHTVYRVAFAISYAPDDTYPENLIMIPRLSLYYYDKDEDTERDFTLTSNSYFPGSVNFNAAFRIAEDVTGLPIGVLSFGHFEYNEEAIKLKTRYDL